MSDDKVVMGTKIVTLFFLQTIHLRKSNATEAEKGSSVAIFFKCSEPPQNKPMHWKKKKSECLAPFCSTLYQTLIQEGKMCGHVIICKHSYFGPPKPLLEWIGQKLYKHKTNTAFFFFGRHQNACKMPETL